MQDPQIPELPITNFSFHSATTDSPFRAVFTSMGFSLAHVMMTPGTVSGNNDFHSFSLSLRSQERFEWKISGETSWCRDVSQGDIFFLPKGHDFTADWVGDLSNLGIFLAPALFQQAAGVYLDTLTLHLQAGIRDPLIWQIGTTLLETLLRDGMIDQLYGESAATFLAVHTLKHYSSTTPPSRREHGYLSGQILNLLRDYIDAEIQNPIHLEQLAALANLTTAHFVRVFKRSTGLTPYQYVIRTKIDRAKHLLEVSRLSGREISVLLGYSDQSHFTRQFKQVVGISPSHYREQRKKRP